MAMKGHTKYEAVAGFFEHDEEPTGPCFRAVTKPGLGLINRTYDTDAEFDPKGNKSQWERFVYFLNALNQENPGKVQYKLIFVIRHGEGFHNVKEAEVGRQEWDSHWSFLEGDGKMNWFDSFLTEKGKQQARALHAFWQESIKVSKMPTPQVQYTSPHVRCLETTRITYRGLQVPDDRPFRPLVKERLRERSGEHTCDRRRTKAWITTNYPEYQVEPGFDEEDTFWKADVRESEEEVEARVKKLLDEVFTDDGKTIVSFTCHSGLIKSLYSVTKHSDVWVSPGTIVPLLLKAEMVV